jgi:hypothetical protein
MGRFERLGGVAGLPDGAESDMISEECRRPRSKLDRRYEAVDILLSMAPRSEEQELQGLRS